jgi:hypothetical protein
MDWIDLAYDTDWRRPVVNMVMDIIFVLLSINVTFTFYYLLFVVMFRPHEAIFRCYSILSRSWCSVMPIFCLCQGASHVLLLMVCLLSVGRVRPKHVDE